MTEREKIIAMAKGRLMKAGFVSSEIAAHRYMQKTSMDRRVNLEIVAREILNGGGRYAPRLY